MMKRSVQFLLAFVAFAPLMFFASRLTTAMTTTTISVNAAVFSSHLRAESFTEQYPFTSNYIECPRPPPTQARTLAFAFPHSNETVIIPQQDGDSAILMDDHHSSDNGFCLRKVIIATIMVALTTIEILVLSAPALMILILSGVVLLRTLRHDWNRLRRKRRRRERIGLRNFSSDYLTVSIRPGCYYKLVNGFSLPELSCLLGLQKFPSTNSTTTLARPSGYYSFYWLKKKAVALLRRQFLATVLQLMETPPPSISEVFGEELTKSIEEAIRLGGKKLHAVFAAKLKRKEPTAAAESKDDEEPVGVFGRNQEEAIHREEGVPAAAESDSRPQNVVTSSLQRALQELYDNSAQPEEVVVDSELSSLQQEAQKSRNSSAQPEVAVESKNSKRRHNRRRKKQRRNKIKGKQNQNLSLETELGLKQLSSTDAVQQVIGEGTQEVEQPHETSQSFIRITSEDVLEETPEEFLAGRLRTLLASGENVVWV